MMLNSITVSQLNNYVKALVENDIRLTHINLSGEISNFKNHFSSGHWYFTLKDANASIRCVMFRSSASRVKFNVCDGISVILKGKVSLYEKDGQYQFYAEEMHSVGDGDLALQYKQVKEKLEKEGLFDQSTKRKLVKYPKKIAVITSDTGAAIQDILNITSSRYPCCKIIMCPVLVQGESAANDMVKTLNKVYSLDDIDCIIIGRGGGSAEDLHCFNDESLARKIYESPFPVISAVGHETDFTICDFVADVRASTPSHAAELAVPDMNDILLSIDLLQKQINNSVSYKYDSYYAKNDFIKSKFKYQYIKKAIDEKQFKLNETSNKIVARLDYILQNKYLNTSSLISRIDALSPLKIMSKGFSIVYKNNCNISDASELCVDDCININFSKGSADCIVKNINIK